MAKQKKPRDPRIVAILMRFGGELEMQFALAEPPVTFRSLQAMARATPQGVPLPQTSVWRICRGENARPAQWSVIHQMLALCGVSEQKIIEVWRPKYEQLLDDIRAAELAQVLPAVQQAVECSICGAAVLNEAAHQAYHEEQQVQRRRRAIRPVSPDRSGGRSARMV